MHHIGHMHQTEHLTVTQAAKILGLSRWTVARALNRGELVGEKLGDNTVGWLTTRADVEAYREKRDATSAEVAS